MREARIIQLHGWFHKSDRVAITAGERLIVLDPAKPNDRTELARPQAKGWLSHPISVSPDDGWVACTSNFGLDADSGVADMSGLVFWGVGTRKGTAISLIPKNADKSEQWMSNGVTFGPKGKLFAWRSWSSDEVPENKAEKDMPAERRGVVRIDLPSGKLVPLKGGQTIYTLSCAIDPTGKWLATAGSARPAKPRADGIVVMGEIRVYHLPTMELAYSEQVEGLPLSWVAFTPGGKRVVSATANGVIKWWDVKEK